MGRVDINNLPRNVQLPVLVSDGRRSYFRESIAKLLSHAWFGSLISVFFVLHGDTV
jgi:hypothetical protein